MSLELMQAFDFTIEDLAYNRAGKLSPRQLAKYKRKSRRSSVFSLFLSLGFGLGTYFTLKPFWEEGLAPMENLGRFIGGTVLGLLALFFFALLFEKDKPVIKSAQGKVQFVVKESDTPHDDGTVTTSTTHYVVIGDEYFAIDKKQYQYLEQGHVYIFYKETSLFGKTISLEYLGPPTI